MQRKIELKLRGVRLGSFASPRSATEFDARDRAQRAEFERLWSEDRALYVPGAIARSLPRQRARIESSLALFERLRRGASFEEELWRRMPRRSEFRPAGATIDSGDSRELMKVFSDGMRGSRPVARDLYAKLSWIAHDERDPSLRIRFSFGSEALLDWQMETRRAPWADRFADAVFPECAAITESRELVALIEHLIGRRARFSERIVYNNAPGGGALFHHDDEEHQLGVVYSQLDGETAWFALPKRDLAREILAAASGKLRQRLTTVRRVLRALNDTNDEALITLLNRTPSFAKRLAERGVLFHLVAGDSILLPAHGPDDVCWHAVIGLGPRPSLSHSYGIFARKR